MSFNPYLKRASRLRSSGMWKTCEGWFVRTETFSDYLVIDASWLIATGRETSQSVLSSLLASQPLIVPRRPGDPDSLGRPFAMQVSSYVFIPIRSRAHTYTPRYTHTNMYAHAYSHTHMYRYGLWSVNTFTQNSWSLPRRFRNEAKPSRLIFQHERDHSFYL